MNYANIFQKLDQDIASELQDLQVKQKELLDKKKKLLHTQQKIQSFLNSAREVKELVDLEPELIKSLRTELSKIFAMNNHSVSNTVPKLPLDKEEKKLDVPNFESDKGKSTSSEVVGEESAGVEEESINNFNFVDAQGKKTSTD